MSQRPTCYTDARDGIAELSPDQVLCCVLWSQSGSSSLTQLLAGLESTERKRKSKHSSIKAIEDPSLRAAFTSPGLPLQPVVVAVPPSIPPESAKHKAERKLKRSLKRKVDRAVSAELKDTEGNGDGDGDSEVVEAPAKVVKVGSRGGKLKAPAHELTAAEQERLARTVFVGNLSASLSRRQLQRTINRFLHGVRGSLDELAALVKAGEGDGDDDSVEDRPVDNGDFGGVDSAFVPGRDMESPVESVRLRSLPIQGVSVESGSDFKKMRKVRLVHLYCGFAQPLR